MGWTTVEFSQFVDRMTVGDFKSVATIIANLIDRQAIRAGADVDVAISDVSADVGLVESTVDSHTDLLTAIATDPADARAPTTIRAGEVNRIEDDDNLLTVFPITYESGASQYYGAHSSRIRLRNV